LPHQFHVVREADQVAAGQVAAVRVHRQLTGDRDAPAVPDESFASARLAKAVVLERGDAATVLASYGNKTSTSSGPICAAS